MIEDNKNIIIGFVMFILVVLIASLITTIIILKNKNSNLEVNNVDVIEDNEETLSNDRNNDNTNSNDSNKNSNSQTSDNDYKNNDDKNNDNINSKEDNSNKKITEKKPEIQWMIKADSDTGKGNDIIKDIIVDNKQNILIYGYSDADIEIRKTSKIVNQGDDDYFLAKISSNGDGIFTLYPDEGELDDYINDVYIKNDDFYVCGNTRSNIEFNVNANSASEDYEYRDFENLGGYDFFLTKYNNDEEKMIFFARSDASKDDFCKFVYVDNNGNSYIIGETENDINLENYVDFDSTGDIDSFLFKVNDVFEPQYAINPLYNLEYDNSYVIDFETTEKFLYILGYSDIESDAGGRDINNFYKTYLSKISYNGEIEWIQFFYSQDDNIPVKLEVINDENIFVGVNFEKDLIVGKTIIPNHGNQDFAILKFNSKGNLEWNINPIYSPGEDLLVDFDINQNENSLYFVLTTEDELSLDYNSKDIITSNKKKDMFIVKYDLDGKFKWSTTNLDFTGQYDDVPVKIIAKNNGVYLAGYTESDIDFGNNVELINQGENDIFIVRYSNYGDPLWVLTTEESKELLDEDEDNYRYLNSFVDVEFSGEENDIITDMEIVGGYLYITGETKGNLDFTKEYVLENQGNEDFFIAKYKLFNQVIE